MKILRGRLAARYIFLELLPGFILGVLVFVSILLMFQALRLTEFVLVHGGDAKTTIQMVFYLTVSFLPAVLPMSLLFSVLLTFGRLSSDSEIVAFKAAGLHLGYLLFPTLLLGALVAGFSAHTSFYSAPWGNRQFEVLISKIGSTKAAAAIREGTFSEGFFDLVIYAKEVDSKNNKLEKVFIYNEQEGTPVTIIAKRGQIISNTGNFSQGALLRLTDGNIHRTSEESYTKIDFENYDLSLSRPVTNTNVEKSPLSLTLDELVRLRKDQNLPKDQKLTYEIEFHKRLAIAATCILFSLLGVGLGTNTNRRSVRSGSLVLSIGVIVSYWAMYVTGENLARSVAIPAWIPIWFANVFFLGMSIWLLRKNWN